MMNLTRLLVGLICLGTVARAADKTPKLELPTAQAEACQIDVKTHCGETEKAGVQKCLHDHAKDLTPPCQAKVNEDKAKANELKNASPMDRASNIFKVPGT